MDVLYTLDLEQEAVLDVEVHGRRRGRGGDEQIPGPPRHSALAVGDELVHLVQAFVDQLGVLGSLVDVTQRDPDAVSLDVLDRLRRWAVPDVDVAAVVREREVAAFAPHGFRRQTVGEIRDRVDGE